MATVATRSFHPVAAEVLAGLNQHRLLSTPQVHALYTPEHKMHWAQTILADLRKNDPPLVAYVGTRTAPPTRLHFLTEQGHRAVASTARLEQRKVQVTPEGAAGALQAHTLAVNDVGVAFVKAARERDDECGPLAWRHEIAHTIAAGGGGAGGNQVIADAVLHYTRFAVTGEVDMVTRFVEVDRATMPLADLADKMRRYARLHGYVADGETQPGWMQSYPHAFPPVMIVFAGKSREALERRMFSLMAVLDRDPLLSARAEVAVTATLLEDLLERGPFAPIFVRHRDPATYVDWLGRAAV